MMIKKILVAIDVSLMSRWVVNTAISIAKQTQAQLGLLHILPVDESVTVPDSELETLEEYPTPTDSAIKCYIGHWHFDRLTATDNPDINILKSYTHDAIAQGVAAEFFQCLGEPGEAICDFARLWQANLIVIGHRGHSGLTELLLGSVSHYVANHAPCSVHIVRPTIQTSSTESAAIAAVLR
ncbi:universal stress protein [Oscillatoria sp. FACHB-1407]|uniref:universal stress protein n=1 Tax=Oscillatoria sp. FACHB-1407 TaxID=2692847 RepID=UPI001687060F|nr:universal stress protein [Oscillatoria sp. FACHB-1407]MBD2464753.1 universal stress protein [Oscillatoria sp. FACHB-1407]